MTKLKCNVCGEKDDMIYMSCECSNCYIKGAEKERKKALKEVIDYLSKRGFRESNYEMKEIYKWLLGELEQLEQKEK